MARKIAGAPMHWWGEGACIAAEPSAASCVSDVGMLADQLLLHGGHGSPRRVTSPCACLSGCSCWRVDQVQALQ